MTPNRLRLTVVEKEALLEAGSRWITQMEGWTYDPKPLRRALDKIETSLPAPTAPEKEG